MDWCIKIVSTDDGVAFQPDVPDEPPPGTPLRAAVNDLIAWNNRTANPHQPWQADSGFQPVTAGALTGEIAAWENSPSAFRLTKPATGKTFFYVCIIHPEEHGTIEIP